MRPVTPTRFPPPPAGVRVRGSGGSGSVSVGRRGAEVDPEGEDPVLDGGLSVPDHGEVHEVGLGLLFEPLAVGPLDRRQASGSHGVCPGPEPFHHGIGVEVGGHGSMVAGRQCATNDGAPHYTASHW
jgi:hypothetical protein